MLEVDFVLHRRLRERGLRLAFEPGAVVVYRPFGRLRQTASANHLYGRLLAAHRARLDRWSPARRLVYGVGSPVGATALHMARTIRGAARGSTSAARALACVPMVLVIRLAFALGEARGYLLGEGEGIMSLPRWEVHSPR